MLWDEVTEKLCGDKIYIDTSLCTVSEYSYLLTFDKVHIYIRIVVDLHFINSFLCLLIVISKGNVL